MAVSNDPTGISSGAFLPLLSACSTSAFPIAAFTAVLGAVYMFFKCSTQYYEWKERRIQNRKKQEG